MGQFTIRIYGILEYNGKILLTQERHRGIAFTKFPGGGLEFGESMPDCLVREFKEEFDLDIEVTAHFFTTDEKLISAFDPNTQVISVYYRVKPLANPLMIISLQPSIQKVDWLPLSDLTPSHLTFPMDQKVAGLLISQRA